MPLTRRSTLGLGAAAIAGAMLPRPSRAATTIVATTYPGSFDEAFKAVVGPAFAKRTGASVTFSSLLNVDQIGKIQASRNNPPFDIVLFDEGPLINAIKADVLEKFPAAEAKISAISRRRYAIRTVTRRSSPVSSSASRIIPRRSRRRRPPGATCGSPNTRAASASPG